MSNSETSADDLPTDTTPEFRANLHYEDENEIEEEEPIILHSEDFISEPYMSENCTIPYDILEMDYSYGYDCKKYFNLVAPDEKTIVYVGGNMLHFLDVDTKKLWFRRSYLGGGIGHVTCNPNVEYPHLTVAENGDNPPIIIYEWPSMEIVGILKEGAAKRYAHINYSPDGELLVSQSYDPDFLITVWKWKKWRQSPIILRTKAHVHDVYTVMFSPYVPGQITTAGSGHIKFWKMAETFTGLKLQGEIGRFGKTEISDVVGIFPMPDEKVISGSEWGNLLVWEAGLIKIEVFQTLRRNCHKGPVMQLEYIRSKGEIWSVSQDGWLRAWNYRIIDEADPPEEDRIVQMIPTYEREINEVSFMSICKKMLYDPEDTFYFAQDLNGGIWEIDLILQIDYEPPKRLLYSHAGIIKDMASCPWGPYIVSLGEGGKLLLFNYESKLLISQHKFPAEGRAILWLPRKIHLYYLVAGFDDGVVRLFIIDFQQNYEYHLVQSVKPHNKPVTRMTLNDKGNIFVTGGEDYTIFIFELLNKNNELSLIPIGFVPLSGICTCFTWHPSRETILLVGCNNGDLLEFNLPSSPVPYTKISYLLHTIKPAKQKFTSCKSKIRRELHIKQELARKAEKVERKRQEIVEIKRNNPGIEIDEELFIQDSESEEILEPLYIPEVPNPIYFMVYTPEDTIWLSMGGYDAGYIYEYHMDQKQNEPLKATMVNDADDVEMYEYIYSYDEKYMITSMQNGAIRINSINRENFRDLSDYWQLSMHDNFNGKITRMCFSFDNKYFFSCGEDGNLFSYTFKCENNFKLKLPRISMASIPSVLVKDENYSSLSLEEKMLKAEEDKQMQLANEHKRKLRQRLKELTAKLTSLLDRNCKLPSSQRYSLREFIVDERIMKALDDILDAKVALEKRKLAYDVEKSTIALRKMKKHYINCIDTFPFILKAINTDSKVMIILQRDLSSKFFNMLQNVKERLKLEALKDNSYQVTKVVPEEKLPERDEITGQLKTEMKKPVQPLEPFLVGLSPSTIAFKLGGRITRMLQKYRARRLRKEQRQEEWNALLAQKPVEGINHPDDEKALKEAQLTIGDYKLKSAKNYKVMPENRETTVKKCKQILEARLWAHQEMVRNFNEQVIRLRDRKVMLVKELQMMTNRLKCIHDELPSSRILQPPPIPEISPGDFPEKEIELKLEIESDFNSYIKREKMERHTSYACEIVDFEKQILGIEHLPNISGNSREIIQYMTKQFDTPFDPFKKRATIRDDNKDSPWEKEMKTKRLIRKIYDQEAIIAKMHTMIADFDEKVANLVTERVQKLTDCAFLELHILMLNQELVIVKNFEHIETELSKVALQKWSDMMDMRDNMKRTELKIEMHLFQIDNCNEQIKLLQQTFVSAAKDNKFWDFLRRIFKKKYRPPKVVNPDDSESSSFSSESSTDSDEDDTGSLDSRDIGPIRLDESICPKGCDKELYDYTFSLRSQRHEMEKQIKDEHKSIELLKKELEQAAKKMKVFDQANKKAQNDLEEYQRLKQMNLNEVNSLVTLKLSQLKHLNPDNCSVAKLSDTVVFECAGLDHLYNRVGELQLETLAERTRHRRNKLHLHRMNVDCKSMKNTIAELRKTIADTMMRKFGSTVKIDEIEESILKRLILNLRINMLHLEKEYEEDIRIARILYSDKQVALKDIIRENTARLEVLTILNKEKVQLSRILDTQAKCKEKLKYIDNTHFLKDVDKLSALVQSQQDQIEILKREIKRLSTKSLPAKPITREVVEKLSEEPELVGDFGSLDELYEPPEFYPEEEKLMQVISPIQEDQPVTEEEIIICIHELMMEVVQAIALTEDTEEQMIVKILSEILDQIPMNYLEKENSVEYIAGLIRNIITNINIETSSLVEKVSQITNRSLQEITGIIESILFKVCTKDDEQSRGYVEENEEYDGEN